MLSGISTKGDSMLRNPWLMHDSAIPPSKPLDGFHAVAGYIGGDTPHVWTPKEWKRFRGFPKLPIYVNNLSPDSYQDGKTDAFKAMEQLLLIGCKPGHPVAYDLETAIVPMRVQGFATAKRFFGYDVWAYGSLDFIFKIKFRNPSYWPADYTPNPSWPSRDSRALQFKADVPVAGEPNIDISWVRWWQVKFRMWK